MKISFSAFFILLRTKIKSIQICWSNAYILILFVIVRTSSLLSRLYTTRGVGIPSSNLSCILPCTQHKTSHIASAPYIILEWTDLLLLSRQWLYSFLEGHRLLRQTLLDAAAAKSLQSCPTLCNPIDGSPPGSPVPEILQARTLEWVAISFSNAWKWKVKGKSLSHVRCSATPWTAAFQAPPSMGFSRQEYWSGVPLPSPHYWIKRYKFTGCVMFRNFLTKLILSLSAIILAKILIILNYLKSLL